MTHEEIEYETTRHAYTELASSGMIFVDDGALHIDRC